MAIRTVVTRGYGNGTYNGTIGLVVTRGYISEEPPPPPDVRWQEIHRGRIPGLIDLVYTPFNTRRY